MWRVVAVRLGPVFSKVAQRIYSKNVTTDINLAKDSTAVYVPDVKNGNVMSAQYVLDKLGSEVTGRQGLWSGAWHRGGSVWNSSP